MFSVEHTIQSVEKLYHAITGHEAPAPNGSYAAIPPEKDPVVHVEESIAKLEEALSTRAAAAEPPWAPGVDLCETSLEYTIFADIPGVERTDIRVGAAGRVITISGERARSPVEMSVVRRERPRGSFLRVIALAPDARLDEATARLEPGGVLEIRVPRGTTRAASVQQMNIDVV